MNFLDFATLCDELEKTPSRLTKVAASADYLRRLDPDEIRPGVAFLSGRPFPISDARTLDVGPGALVQIAEIPQHETTVLPQLTITDVADCFAKIAEASGKGSRAQRSTRLRELMEMVSARERRVLFRLLHHELRIGLHDGLIQESIARASGSDLKVVRRAALFLSDLAEVAFVALTEGRTGLERVEVKLFVPLLPMLSERSQDFDAILNTHHGKTALEYKYDGARVQIHKDTEQIRIWSRRLTEVTNSLPDIAGIAWKDLRGDSFILDAEVVAMGKDGRPLPFQDLMRRFRRVHRIETATGDIPLCLCLFDCLYLDGRSLIDEPYELRWQKLGEISGGKHLAAQAIVIDKKSAEVFLAASLAAGHEGLMAKALDSSYMPGNRGKLWFKVKPAETVDCVIVAADRGSGRRRGWLSNYTLPLPAKPATTLPSAKPLKV
ncbi:MAG TPA: ATP-dependent DNA ligase [Candidatus Limnocylindria bacterium]|nr:ATP-dependent DNA ligase [Candidatus Limnocylindria bacterium]